MGTLLEDERFAVRGRLVAIDNSGLVGPMFVLRVPPTTFDLHRPGSYIDLHLLDARRKTLQKRIHLDDELDVIVHAATAGLDAGTRNELTFDIAPRSQCQRVSHCARLFTGARPINGKVAANDGRKLVAVDAGLPVVVLLLGHTPTKTKSIEVGSWVMFWPAPPTHGIILGKV